MKNTWIKVDRSKCLWAEHPESIAQKIVLQVGPVEYRYLVPEEHQPFGFQRKIQLRPNS